MPRRLPRTPYQPWRVKSQRQDLDWSSPLGVVVVVRLGRLEKYGNVGPVELVQNSLDDRRQHGVDIDQLSLAPGHLDDLSLVQCTPRSRWGICRAGRVALFPLRSREKMLSWLGMRRHHGRQHTLDWALSTVTGLLIGQLIRVQGGAGN